MSSDLVQLGAEVATGTSATNLDQAVTQRTGHGRVFVSPVRSANVAASSSVVRFLMFNAIRVLHYV